MERVEFVDNSAEKEKFNYFASIGRFFKNKPAIGLTLASFSAVIMTAGLTSASQILYQVYFKNARISGVVSLITMFSMFAVMPAVKPIVKKYGKKNGSIAGLLISAVGATLMVVLPVDAGTSGLITWTILTMIVMLGMTFFNVVVWAMVADAIDYQQYTTGIREEGTVYAYFSFGRKLAQGVGASLISYLLMLTGYNALLGANQVAQVSLNIKLLVGMIQLVTVILQIVFLSVLYTLNKKEEELMMASLYGTKAE